MARVVLCVTRDQVSVFSLLLLAVDKMNNTETNVNRVRGSKKDRGEGYTRTNFDLFLAEKQFSIA